MINKKMSHQKLNSIAIFIFCTISLSCSPTKSQIHTDISNNINDYEDIKNYLIDRYRVDNENVWMNYNEDSKTLAYVGSLNPDRNINDEKLISFFDKHKIKNININWKASNNDYYLFKDSILTLEFKSSPFIQKRKLLYFDNGKSKIADDGSTIFKIQHGTYLVYSKPHSY